MAKVRADYVFGTTDTALTTSTTTLSSPALSRLPAVASPDTATLTLHDSSAGTYEIVYVTAHTAGATTATIQRAQEGTTARAWGSSTTWLHGFTVADFIVRPQDLTADPTYGDKMTSGTVASKWTVSGDFTMTAAPDGYSVSSASTYGRALETFTDSGQDFEIVMHITGLSTLNGMFGIMALDASNNGIGFSGYTSSTSYVWGVTNYQYATSGQQIPYAPNTTDHWLSLRRMGGVWQGRVANGGSGGWIGWSPNQADTRVITKIGFGRMYNVGGALNPKIMEFNYRAPSTGLPM